MLLVNRARMTERLVTGDLPSNKTSSSLPTVQNNAHCNIQDTISFFRPKPTTDKTRPPRSSSLSHLFFYSRRRPENEKLSRSEEVEQVTSE